jgi:hypothetical protein
MLSIQCIPDESLRTLSQTLLSTLRFRFAIAVPPKMSLDLGVPASGDQQTLPFTTRTRWRRTTPQDPAARLVDTNRC